ncbi:OmpA family protein [Candidatus Parabeggiatoa sp. HSG14]|uniref:OmpA family protein n=1 Tax=Candidatus Parabeggiatoa sp. HSG14 TaxID=3055593 RepID=UPI0025A749BA|nr:OmpA family protein [Thiotrichales bacterium HSG14]
MFTQYKFSQLGFLLLILNVFQPAVASSKDCDLATDLLFRAYHLYTLGKATSHQKLLFSKSLGLCSDKPEVHATLASIFEKQANYPKAAYHYQEALRYDKKFDKAWYGVGETYYKQQRFPLSLEAHLQVCQTNKKSKAQIMNILKNLYFFYTDKNRIIDQESLLVLYDRQRRQALNRIIFDCGIPDVEIPPRHIFLNFDFQLGESTLSTETERQLDEIAAALKQLNSPIIKIHGHADSRRFRQRNLKTSNKLNQQLSEDRAVSIAIALGQRGILTERLKTFGHGYTKPLFPGSSQLAINRRVEIEVE